MTLYKKPVFSRITHITKYLCNPYDALSYIGILGIKNLGDEAVYTAVKSCFKSLPVYSHILPGRPAWLGRLIARKKVCGTILGGGTLIGGGSRSGNPCLDAFETAERKKQLLFVFGTGVSGVDFAKGDTLKEQMRIRWYNVLKNVKYLGVRGPDSVKTLNEWGLEAEMIGDPACQFTPDKSLWKKDSMRIGINVGKSDKDFPHLYEAIAELIRHQEKSGFKVEFFVVWPDDLGATYHTAELAGIKNPIVHKLYYDPAGYVRIAGNLRCFIGLKLHSTILALCAGIPSIMLNYNPKCLDFMKSIGMEKYSIPVSEITDSVFNERLNEIIDNGNEISDRVFYEMKKFKKMQIDQARNLAVRYLK